MTEKVVDKYGLLKHLPKHQQKFMIKNHPDYVQKLTDEYEAKIKRAMDIPPGVYAKFSEQEERREIYQKFLNKIKESKSESE